jgi:hypothetical protein
MAAFRKPIVMFARIPYAGAVRIVPGWTPLGFSEIPAIGGRADRLNPPPIAEIAKTHSMTSSAIAITPDGMVRPSALAVLRLMTSSNLTGAWTGSSLGSAPMRMRSA